MSQTGLCETCSFGRRVQSARGSVFWRCGRADRETGYPRYPRLPVAACGGFEAELAGSRRGASVLGEPGDS